jgi:hypothetical protein
MDMGKTFGTSSKLETEGVWRDIGEGGEVKIARINNREHQKVMRQLMAPHRAAQRASKLPQALIEKIAIEGVAIAILKDWKGCTDEGKPLGAYTDKEGVRMLTKYPDFLDFVSAVATDMTNFQEEHEAEASKNSPSSSPGS